VIARSPSLLRWAFSHAWPTTTTPSPESYVRRCLPWMVTVRHLDVKVLFHTHL
jgi:hypothetical protein